jgi:hypothetical protein
MGMVTLISHSENKYSQCEVKNKKFYGTCQALFLIFFSTPKRELTLGIP